LPCSTAFVTASRTDSSMPKSASSATPDRRAASVTALAASSIEPMRLGSVSATVSSVTVSKIKATAASREEISRGDPATRARWESFTEACTV
jgi:hypothetical protein